MLDATTDVAPDSGLEYTDLAGLPSLLSGGAVKL